MIPMPTISDRHLQHNRRNILTFDAQLPPALVQTVLGIVRLANVVDLIVYAKRIPTVAKPALGSMNSTTDVLPDAIPTAARALELPTTSS
jgi:hypothetical protein